ncbi:globin [Gordoniibacillus kamchatkensis]|uniref:Globin n=1 Tax=Gordoniibacillus kamchatkensis TaxID=1590651 RepID=A0ABR5AMQ8_9BACL|nr:globin [Paenibacillus sp. VKM B-2647]KIL42247.1 globin [Paenibacillus sp. VKM B-2647]
MEEVRQHGLVHVHRRGPTIRKIVDAFYPKVAEHPDLKPIFPDDLTPVADKQYLFLTQFFGGPPLYTEKYGHPMMRARHMPFPVTPKRAEAWLGCMRRALEEVIPSQEMREVILERLSGPAHFFVNTPDDE